MSAIWALVGLDGQPAEAADLARMSAALAALGPEAEQLWRAGPAGLGFRGMLLTPEDQFEQQPLIDALSGTVLVVDGRLDNRPELARELGLDAAEIRAWPDSRFVQAAYRRWGEACPAHLVGAVAFIAWNPRQRRLFAASTPGNSATLFYTQTPHLLALATMPRGLMPLPGVARELDEEKLADFLVFGRERRAATYYRGVWRLPSGHTLAAQNGQVEIQRYWAPDLARCIRFPRDDDYVAAFLELFERVVSDHRRSQAPLAAMMSGGLDSSSVAVTAARQLAAAGQRLTTYTEVPGPGPRLDQRPGWYTDETPLIDAIARQQPNIDPVFVRTDGACFLDQLAPMFEHQEAPQRNNANFVWLEAILQAARASGQRAMLTGSMGNLTMSWAGQGQIAGYLREGKPRAAWREARALVRLGQSRAAWRAIVSQGLVPLLPEALWLQLAKLRQPELEQSYLAIRPEYARARGLRATRAWNSMTGRPDPDSRHRRFDMLTRKIEHHATAWRGQFGVDVRDPTQDQRLIDFCLAIPPEQFLRDGGTRRLIRRAMAGRLPAEVLSNQQRGRQAADWFDRLSGRRGEISELLLLMERDPLARDMLDLARLRGLAEHWPAPGACTPHTLREYGLLLQQGLMAGAFILWFHGGGSSLPAPRP